MRTIRTFSALLLASFVLAASAPGEAMASGQLCGERKDFIKKLNKAYGERPSSVGLESEGNIFEILRSDEGSWTILATRPSGVSCVVAVGDAWIEGDWKPGEDLDDLAL